MWWPETEGDGPLIVPVVLAFLLGMVTAVFNVVGGGGSLLTIPALVEMGLSPQAANATNRIGVWLQAVVSTTTMVRQKQVPFPVAWHLLPFGVVGAMGGALTASWMDESRFRTTLAVVFAVMGVQLVRDLVSGRHDPRSEAVDVGFSPRLALAFVAVGFYGGFIQAGVGIVILLTLNGLTGMDLRRANGLKVFQVLGFASISLVVFLVVDLRLVAWGPGLIFGAGSMIGGYVGARYNEGIDGRVVGWILVVAVFAASACFAGLL